MCWGPTVISADDMHDLFSYLIDRTLNWVFSYKYMYVLCTATESRLVKVFVQLLRVWQYVHMYGESSVLPVDIRTTGNWFYRNFSWSRGSYYGLRCQKSMSYFNSGWWQFIRLVACGDDFESGNLFLLFITTNVESRCFEQSRWEWSCFKPRFS